MEQLFNSLATITQDIQAVTSSLRKVLGGDTGPGLDGDHRAEPGQADRGGRPDRAAAAPRQLDAILANVEAGVGRHAQAHRSAKATRSASIVENIDAISRDVRDVMAIGEAASWA